MTNHFQERNNNDYRCPSQAQETYSADDELVKEQPLREETAPSLLGSLTDDMFVVEAPSFVVPYLYERPSDKRWNQVLFPESDVIDLSSSSPPKSTNIFTDTYFTSPLGSFFVELGQNLVAESLRENLEQKDGLNPDRENTGAKMKCQQCDFKTDSMFVLGHHLENFDGKEKMPACPRGSLTPRVTQVETEDMHYLCPRGRLMQGARSDLQCPSCPFSATTPFKMAGHVRRCPAAGRLQYNQAPQDWEPPAKVLRQSRQKVIQYAEQKPTPRSHKKKPASEHPLDLSCPVGLSNPVGALGSPFPQPQRFALPTSPSPVPAHLDLLPSPRIPTPLLPQGYSAPRGPIIPPRPFVPQNSKKKVTHVKAAFVICELCDGYVRDLGQLKLHLLVAHAVLSSPSRLPPSPPLCCPHCPLRFYTDKGHQRHLSTEHKLTSKLTHLTSLYPVVPQKSAKITYCCVVCDAGFPQYSLYIQHVEMTHPQFFRKAR